MSKKSLAKFKANFVKAKSLSDKARAINYIRTPKNQIKIGKNPSPQKISGIERAFKREQTKAKTATSFIIPKNNNERHEIKKAGAKTRGYSAVPVTIGQGSASLVDGKIKLKNDNFGEFKTVTLDKKHLMRIGDDIAALRKYILNKLHKAGARAGKTITPAYQWENTNGFYFSTSYSYSLVEDMLQRWISDFTKYGETNVARSFAISDEIDDEYPEEWDKEYPDEYLEFMEIARETNKETEKQRKKQKPKTEKQSVKEIKAAVKIALESRRAALEKELRNINRKLNPKKRKK